jgi:hypothetical protein
MRITKILPFGVVMPNCAPSNDTNYFVSFIQKATLINVVDWMHYSDSKLDMDIQK